MVARLTPGVAVSPRGAAGGAGAAGGGDPADAAGTTVCADVAGVAELADPSAPVTSGGPDVGWPLALGAAIVLAGRGPGGFEPAACDPDDWDAAATMPTEPSNPAAPRASAIVTARTLRLSPAGPKLMPTSAATGRQTPPPRRTACHLAGQTYTASISARTAARYISSTPAR
jgi:hypothetical protein